MQDKETVKEHQRRIDSVIDYILKHINEPVSLKTLAEVAHYSPFYLQKLFKQFTADRQSNISSRYGWKPHCFTLLFILINRSRKLP
jgi:YesN/AraC family two-component response regulator